MYDLSVVKVVIAMGVGGNGCLYSDQTERPTVSAAAAALAYMLGHKKRMEEEGLLPGVIPNDALVRMVAGERLTIHPGGNNQITVSLDGQKSLPLPGTKYGEYTFDPNQGLFIILPETILPFTDHRQCVVATERGITTITVRL